MEGRNAHLTESHLNLCSWRKPDRGTRRGQRGGMTRWQRHKHRLRLVTVPMDTIWPFTAVGVVGVIE